MLIDPSIFMTILKNSNRGNTYHKYLYLDL